MIRFYIALCNRKYNGKQIFTREYFLYADSLYISPIKKYFGR